MKRTIQTFYWRNGRFSKLFCTLAILSSVFVSQDVYGQNRGRQEGKKAKPSMGNVGASGARPMPRPQSTITKPQMPSLKPQTNNQIRPDRPQSRSQQPNVGYQKPGFPSGLPSGRPSLGNSRPGNLPQITKPNIGIPSVRPSSPGNNPGAGRPSTLPTKPLQPSLGTNRPSIGIGQPGSIIPNKPNIGGSANVRPEAKPSKPTRPTTRPNIPPSNGKPTVKPPIEIKPTKPSWPGSRPGIKPPEGTGSRPTPGTKPPSLGQVRPKPLPLPLPENGNGNIGGRPGLSKPSRPTNPNIPGVNRPGQGRPGIGGAITLPGVVGGNNSGWGNNSNWGNSVNINNNVWNNSYININYNRPFWDRPQWNSGWGNSGWGSGWGVYPVQSWHQGWYSHCVHPHYHVWYNGCWSNYWGSSWYAPVVWGGTSWGLNSVYQSYNTVYVNPYYIPISTSRPTAIAYDYSQPIVVNNYQSENAFESASPSMGKEAEALQRFDQALEAFQGGRYPVANQLLKEAIRLNGGDPVTHEVFALSLFAVGDYEAAAATLNALLASAPGMDWTSLSSLYGNIGDYTTQLRRLEDFCEQRPGNASAEFVLAYHYLVLGEKEAAVESLKIVVENQPKDLTAKRMLEALSPPPSPSSQKSTNNPEANAPEIAEELPAVDLVGRWRALKGESLVELTITEDASFVWIASASGQQVAKLEGSITTAPDGIVLETSTSGTLAGKVQSAENGDWTFYPPGASADEGLLFQKQN